MTQISIGQQQSLPYLGPFWDYFDRIEEFQNWYKNTSKLTKFINPKSLIDWNIDKHYLKELHQKGIHISNTVFVESGEKTTLFQAFQKLKHPRGKRR